MDKKREEELKAKQKLYTTKDNTRRLFLFDLLRRKEYLKDIKLNELDNLVYSINSLISNLEYYFRKGEIKINVKDSDNWDSGSLMRDIFLHNILEIPIDYRGTTKDFKDKLLERWSDSE